MASHQDNRPRRTHSAATRIIVKEGFLYKKGGIIKSWSRKYFVLNRQSLCYFKHEQLNASNKMEPIGRIFLSDVVNIQTEGLEKRKLFVFALHTKKRAVLLQAANNEDRDSWVEAIKHASESDSRAEKEDPFRRTLRKLKPGLKRVTLIKDPAKGIGCTIKAAGGCIVVHRIIEDGPIAITGVLRPGDQILDINGTSVSGLQVAEVAVIIKNAPDQFLATVRPITAVTKGHQHDTGAVKYCDIVPQNKKVTSTQSPQRAHRSEIVINPEVADSKLDHSPTPSLEDLGNYDDEEEGDVAPPLPPRSEDYLILVDPPPESSATSDAHQPPPLPPRPRDTESISPAKSDKPRLQREQYRDLLWSPERDRPPMQKAKSQDEISDSFKTQGPIRGRGHVISGRGQIKSGRGQAKRVHVYEDVEPKLKYADISPVYGRKEEEEEEFDVELDWRSKAKV